MRVPDGKCEMRLPSVLRGIPHDSVLNLLPSNFSSLFAKLLLPHGLPVIEHFLWFLMFFLRLFMLCHREERSDVAISYYKKSGLLRRYHLQ